MEERGEEREQLRRSHKTPARKHVNGSFGSPAFILRFTLLAGGIPAISATRVSRLRKRKGSFDVVVWGTPMVDGKVMTAQEDSKLPTYNFDLYRRHGQLGTSEV
jgi:hypothetical protein